MMLATTPMGCSTRRVGRCTLCLDARATVTQRNEEWTASPAIKGREDEVVPVRRDDRRSARRSLSR